MRQRHFHMIMMNSEKEFGINQFKIEDVDLLKNNLDLIVHVKEKQSRNNKVVGCSIIIC
jgi:hypothetical protein